MKKINTTKAMNVIGGTLGCIQVYNKTIVDGKEVCNITVACEDKFGGTSTSSRPTDIGSCS